MKRTPAVSVFIGTALSSLPVAQTRGRTTPDDIGEARRACAASSLGTAR